VSSVRGVRSCAAQGCVKVGRVDRSISDGVDWVIDKNARMSAEKTILFRWVRVL